MQQGRWSFLRTVKRGSAVGLLCLSLLISICATFLAWQTYRRHYFANFTTYLNDTSRPQVGVCRVVLADGYINAVRHRDDKMWLHQGMASDQADDVVKTTPSVREEHSACMGSLERTGRAERSL
jgi:hypothetical protein